MQLTVLGIAQELSFQDGNTYNYVKLALPDGTACRAAVDNDVLNLLIKHFVPSGSEAAARAVREAAAGATTRREQAARTDLAGTSLAGDFATHELENAGGDLEFGGNYDGSGDGPADNDEWVVAEPPAAMGTAEARPAPVVVSADAQGNPIVQGGNHVDQRSISGGSNADLEDDGVGSV